MASSSEDFKVALREILRASEGMGLVAIEVSSGNLHRRVGGYPGDDHRMPACCDAMYAEMGPQDSVVCKPASGKGATVVVRYSLPR